MVENIGNLGERKYRFKHNSIYYGSTKFDAEAIGKELDELKEKLGGNIMDEDVVNAARNKDSAMHNIFEWDVDIAAMKYNKHQAQMLIQSMEVYYEKIDEDKVEEVQEIVFTQFSNINKGEGYKDTELALQNPDEYQTILDKVIARLKALEEQYKHLTELQGVFAEIDKL